MKKRVISIVLTLIMLMSIVPVTAMAELLPAFQLKVTAKDGDLSHLKANDEVTVEVKSPTSVMKAFSHGTFKVSFDKERLELTKRSQDEVKAAYCAAFTEDTDAEMFDCTMTTVKKANENGEVAFAFTNKNTSGYDIPANTVFMVLTFKVKSDAPIGAAKVSGKIESIYGYPNGTKENITAKYEGPGDNTEGVITAALTGDLPVAIPAPAKGDTPKTTITGTNYTGSITWEPAIAAGGKFAANTEYTANVTLTAKDGYQFAEGVNPTVAGADSVTGGEVKDSGSKLEFKATFPETGAATLKGLLIPTLSVAVPTAKPGETVTKDTSIVVLGVYDDPSIYNHTVAATLEIVGTAPTGVTLEGNTLKVTNKASAGKVRVLATFEGKNDNKEITITKAVSKETAIVATAPAGGTNITIPNGGTETSGNCSYKVYDQYGAEMPGTTATWKMDPETVTGVTFIPANGSISVNNTATTSTVKLYAEIGEVKSNEITFNIARAASVPTSLTIEGSADSVNVPTVTEPGTTSCAYATYTAKVKDQYGEVMNGQTIEWSFTGKPGVTFNNDQLTVTNKADAGTVTITAKSGTLTASKTVTINKAAAEVSIVKITAQDNEPPVITIICTGSQRLEYYTATVYDQYGVEKQDDVTWSLDPTTYSGVDYEGSAINNNSVTLKVAPNTAAGTFKLVATSQTVTTVKGELEITVQKKTDVSSDINFNDGSLTYTGEGQKYEKATLDNSVTAGTGVKWTYTYAVKSGATGALDAAGLPKIVGTYTVTATYEDNSNIGSKSATLTITPKKVRIPDEDTTVYTYDGTEKTYGIADTADYTVNNATQINANESGYTVTVALKDKDNTAWKDDTTADRTFNFKIMKATTTGAPAYTKITTSGKTLEDAALTTTGGTFSVSGTVKWVDDTTGADLPATTPVEANKLYKWVFTPTNTNYESINGSIKLWSKSTSSGGGSYVPTVQKPEITIIGSGKADLSADGRTATITAAAGHELVSVVLNGKEMGKVEKLTGLKTGDKATITFRAKTDGKAEMDKIIAQKASKLTLMARSKKTAKLNIKVVVKGDLKAITDAGYTVKYKFYRSTKKSAGYKAMLTKKAPTYFNTYGKKGTMYYYKARVMIYDKDGNFVAQTALKQCKYANRLWTK